VELLKHFFGGALLLFGLFIVLASYVRQITNFRNRKKENGKWSSPAPFVGPVFVVVGYAALPFEFSSWIFLIIVLDPDTLITIVGLPYLIKAFRE
jgi:uncharacterized membrane protein HdeD (DUF308 family)